MYKQNCKPTIKRSLGSPSRWEDNVRMDKEIRVNTRNWVDSAQDCRRALANTALSLRIPKALELVNINSSFNLKWHKLDSLCIHTQFKSFKCWSVDWNGLFLSTLDVEMGRSSFTSSCVTVRSQRNVRRNLCVCVSCVRRRH